MRIELSPRSTPERIEYAIQTDNDIDRVLWYETVLGTPPAVPDRLDAAMISMVPRAMHGGQDLHVVGPVSWSLLANVEEYIDFWTLWLPDLFRPITITADQVIDDRGDGAGSVGAHGVLAFSGGVDATYALVANTPEIRGHRAVPLAAAIQVHGFDVPIEDRTEFDASVATSAPILAAYGVEHVAIRTNWHPEMCPDWPMTFFAALAAVLHHFTDRAAVGLVAPDNSYDHVRLPWGSNAISNPFLASNRFRFESPGSASRRYLRCQTIGAVPEVRENLRVCWEAPRLGRNCGSCEKCIRTKVNFLAAGHGTIAALGPLTTADLAELRVTAEAVIDNYEFMVPALTLHAPEAASAVTEMVARERALLPSRSISTEEPSTDRPVRERSTDEPPSGPTWRRPSWRRRKG